MKHIVCLLIILINCTAAVAQLTAHASCSKWPPPAWIHFPTGVTREDVNFRSTAALFMRLAALKIRRSSWSFRAHLACIHHGFQVTPHTVIYRVQIR
jgi:hypothetical protein